LEAESEASRNWLSRRYGRLGRDLSDPTRYYEKAASDLADRISPSPSPYLSIVSATSEESRILSKDGPIDIPLQVSVFGPASLGLLDVRVDVEANADDPRLEVSAPKETLRLAPGSTASRVVRAAWSEDRGAVRPIPRGFIVGVAVKDGPATR